MQVIIKHCTHEFRATHLGTTGSGREKANGAEDFLADLGQIHGRNTLKQPQRRREQNPRAAETLVAAPQFAIEIVVLSQ